MSGPSLGEYEYYWSVFEIFYLCPAVHAQLANSSIAEQDAVMGDFQEFFDVLVAIMCNQNETSRRYQATIIGLNDLLDFISCRTSTISVRWRYSTFNARHDEFGAVIVTDLTIRIGPTLQWSAAQLNDFN